MARTDADPGPPGLRLVIPESPREDLLSVEGFGQEFSRHFGHVCVFEASEARGSQFFRHEWKAFLFYREGLKVGAACFRDETYRGASIPWLFHWMWLRPEHWRVGLLTTAWPVITAEIPNFRLQRPLSPAMQAFAAKQGWDANRGSLQGGHAL